MACKYTYKGITYNSKEEFINQIINPQFLFNKKVRRVMELQSDLFQKGREKVKLTDIEETPLGDYDTLEKLEIALKTNAINNSLYNIKRERLLNNINSKPNQFLQLLNKDNNWVTFFVKSIIQDSAKKGYEKVLFPSGNTASKVEGHTTLEEFKKQKEDRIKELEKVKAQNIIANKSIVNPFLGLNSFENAQNKIDNEINQLKQELERVETEGFGALKPIYNFYETTVANVLKKQGYTPKQITDEYGNTWNEITINQARELQNVLLQKNEANRIIGQANIKAMTVLIDAVNQKQDTLPHEYAHHYIAWFRNTPLVQEAIKKWGSEEALVQSIGEQAVKQKGEAFDWWEKFTKFVMDLFNNLSTKDKQELTNILTDAFLQGVDLETGKIGISRERSLELARKTSGLFNQEVKPGVAELFESNPELANSVYSALGFRQELSFIKSDNTIDDDFYIKDELLVKDLQNIRATNWDGSVNTKIDNIKRKYFDFLNNPLVPLSTKVDVSEFTNSTRTTLDEVITKANLSESNKILFEKIKPLVKDVTIEYVEEFFNSDSGAVYSDKYNTIRINKSEKRIPLEELLMHELLHAATFRKISYFETNTKGLSKKELTALNELENIRKVLKEASNKYWDNKPRFARSVNPLEGYRTDSIHEIISYAFTNKEFRDAIAEIPYKGTKSILDKLVELIATIFGVKQDTILSALLANAEVLLEDTQITPQQKQQAQQLYSQYLDSIGVTDIAYHHSEEDISEFTSSSERYFQKELKKKNRYIPKLDDIVFLVKKPLTEEFMSKRKFIGSWGLKTPKTLQFNAREKIGEGVHPGIDEGIFAGIEGNYDAIDFGRVRDNKTWSEVVAITNPKNAIKLGSKQDIEGFKEFVGKEEKVEEPVESTKIEKYLETETSEDKEVAKVETKKEVETREKAISDIVTKLKDLLTRLGINLKEFEEIYVEQENINTLTKKLEDPNLTEKQRSDIQNQINALKAKGVDKRAIAFADILNKTIGVSVDGKMEDLTEEVLHFIVDIIEQKYPELYKELYDKIWSYDKYKQVKEDYKDRYETEEEFRKEAIAQVLNDYLLKPLESEPESEYQNQKTEKLWDEIVNSLKNLFTKTANVNVDPFKIAIEKLLNSDFITAEDVQYLNKKGLFYSLRKQKSAEEIRDNLLKGDSELEIKEGKDKKPRYFKSGTEVLKRVSDIVKAYYDSVFRNSEKKDTALNEQKREEGVEIHSIFQHTFAKYVSPKGEVLSTPIAPNEELKKLAEKYPNIATKIDEVVREIIRVNPNSYFLAEVKVSNSTKIGGTLDLVIINKKDGRTSVYDWKSKRGVKYDPKLKSYASISQIPWWNVNGWRIQLSEYTKILKANGITNFGEIRMIPVLTFEKKVGNEYVIDRIEITSFDRALIDPRKRQLLPVIGEEEKSPYKTINKITEKIRAVINQNIQRIKADYKLKPDLEEENAALENMYTVLLATDNISSALGSLKVILQDAKELANKAVLDKKKINELSDSEIYQYYKDIQSTKEKLSVYQEAKPDGTPIFTILGLADDIFGKKTTKIREEYEDLLQEFRQNPTQELDDELKKLKPSYDIAVSLIKIEAELKEVLPTLNQYSEEYFDAYATRNGVTDILGEDLGQSFLGKFMNNVRGLYSLNFKTAQLAKKVLMKANSIVRDKNKKATESIYALRDKFLKGESVFDIEDLFKNLIYYDKDKNDYFLVPEINKEFTKQFFEIKEKFEKGYNANGKLFFSTKEYQEIKEWMEKNLEMDVWKKDFEEKKKAILSKFEQANKALKNSDPVDYASLLATKEAQIEYFNNILTSPKALESLKKYKYVKRSKWESPEYKKLTPEEKEIHKKFTSIYARAESIGYVQGYQNYYRIPFKLRESKAFLQSLKPSQSFIATKEDDVYNSFTRIDPVTGEEIIEIPTHMTTYLPAIEKGKRVKSLDLFQVYLEFEQNVNRFEEMTKVEDLLLDLVRIENNKDKEKEVNIFGNLTGEKSQKEKSGLLTITREDALKKLVYNALYKIKYERDVFIPSTKVNLKNVFKDRKYVSVKKTFQWLNNYSTALFIQASLKITGGAFIASSVVAGTSTSKNIQGSKYFTSLLGRLNPKNINSSYRKAFNHSITQREVEELNLRRTETLKRLALYGKEYLLNHLKHVDTFVQDAVFDASLEKWLVVDNKIVNAETYISSLIPNQDKMSYQEIKKKEAEIYEKNKENTLAKYLEKNTKDKKTDISKLDKNSVYEFEQALRLESKKIVGNMSEEDMFAMRTGFFGAIFTKFKTWMPELFNTFFGGVYWREEGKRFEAGRFTSFYKSVMDAVDNTDASGDEKSMMKMGIEYVSNALMLLYNAGLFTAGRNKDAVIKRLETRYNLYVENLEELKVDKIPTKKEYIDLTLQEAENARNFMASVFVLYLFSNILSVLSGDDDPEDHEYLVGAFDAIGLTLEPVDNEILLLLFQFANNFTGKGLKELQTYFSAESTYEAFAKLSFPALGALSILGKGAVEAGKTITPFADGEIKYTLDAIPVVRPALRTYIKYSDDEWLQEQLNVDKNYRLRKEEEEE